MKIKPDALATMRAAIAPLDTPQLRSVYLAGDIPNADKVKDIDKRYRWDLCHGASIPWGFFTALYDEGCNDNHIDTALRSIVPPLEPVYLTNNCGTCAAPQIGVHYHEREDNDDGE